MVEIGCFRWSLLSHFQSASDCVSFVFRSAALLPLVFGSISPNSLSAALFPLVMTTFLYAEFAQLKFACQFLGQATRLSWQATCIYICVDVPYFFRTVRARRNALPPDENEKV